MVEAVRLAPSLRPRDRRRWAVPGGSCTVLALLAAGLGQLPRLAVSAMPTVFWALVGVSGVLFLLLVSYLVCQFAVTSIRNRLLVAFVLVVSVPAMIFALVSTMVGLRNGQRQVFNQLDSVATIKEAELNTWAASVQGDLATAVIGEETLKHMRDVLTASSDAAEYQIAYEDLHDRFEGLVRQSPRLDELFIMDLQRRVVVSTDRSGEGGLGSPGSNAYFKEGLKGEYLHRASYYTLSVGGIAIIAVRPILAEDGQVLGILGGRAGPATLTQIMLERTGLGSTGETYLVTHSHIMLTEPRFALDRWSSINYVFSQGANAAIDGQSNGSGIYLNYRSQRVIGVYRWLPVLQVALLAEQAESEAMSGVYTTLAVNVAVALAAVAVAGVVSLYLARSIADPLADLAETAEKVAAGELEHSISLARRDEIGALGTAFNTMTVRLRGLIAGLEDRVRERTEALQRRAVQLETSTRVSQEITSILDADQLLTRVVEVVAQAFGYYYVGVFLVDTEGGNLVFAAGNGDAGRKFKSEGLRLEIGADSLNGRVAQTGSPLLVNDVSLDTTFGDHEALPHTRSELVIPLRLGERVIGTLDVQSEELNTFREDDVRVMQSLADQVAVAIENARLYDRSQDAAVLEERNRLARELHDSVTQLLYSLVLLAGAASKIVDDGEQPPTKQHLARIEETAQQALKEMRLLVYELRPLALDEEGLVGALNQRLDTVERRAGIQARLMADGDLDLPPMVEEEVYRIVHEALNNALKHSGAGSVSVTLSRDGEWVQVEIVDDGRGFDTSSTGDAGGVGLASMRERAEALGGSVTVVSAPHKGTEVLLRVPASTRTRRRRSVGAER
jgi:signal transduction histidine kinase